MDSRSCLFVNLRCVLCFVLALSLSHVLLGDERAIRRPVALAVSPNGKTVFAANRDSRSISIVDVSIPALIGEFAVAGRLTDIVAIAEDRLLALDEEHSKLLSIEFREGDWKIASSTPVPRYPVRIAVDASRTCCYVTSLWSRTLTRYSISSRNGSSQAESPQADSLQNGSLEQTGELDLQFEPMELCLTQNDSDLVVASAFDAALSFVDLSAFEIVRTERLSGHNIGGLAIKGDGGLVWTMQQLSPLAHSTRDDVHWGNMISNVLVELPPHALLNNQTALENQMVQWPLGEPGDAAGDPGAVYIGKNDSVAIALSGVGQVAIGQMPKVHALSGKSTSTSELKRVKVGRRPIAITADGERLIVANMFSDSLAVMSLENPWKATEVRLGDMKELTAEQKGEQLFFDSRLSLDGWMSCHSCHTLGHTNHRLNDNLSDGAFGAPKLVPSLLGVADSGPWAWNGSVSTLEEQVEKSVQNTMHGQILPEDVKSIAAYLKTLKLPESTLQQQASNSQVDQGAKLFAEFECASCHAPPAFTTPRVYDVKLADELGNREFNPPSLRGLVYRSPLLHDGRAKSLTEVFQVHQHGVTRQLSDAELAALVAYLKTL